MGIWIFQPDRILLHNQVKDAAHYAKGIILDIGSGGYLRYRHLFGNCESYVTLDIRPRNKPSIIADAHGLPIKSSTIDTVLCAQVLEHLEEPSKVVKEFWRVLQKGGICIVTVPQINELHEEPSDFRRFTKYGLLELFKHSFEIICLEQRGGFFSATGQMIIRYLIDRLHLYSKRRYRTIIPFITLFGRAMIKLDKVDNSKANRKHTIGWCIVARKAE